jgi:hypothetical protein
MSCTQIAPASSQFPGGSCRDDNTGNNVDCKSTVCGNPGPPQAFNVNGAPPLLAPAGYETTSFAGVVPTQVKTLGYYMSTWVQGVIGFPSSIQGTDPLTAARQSALGYCQEAAGSLPDCTSANIEAYAQAAAAQIAGAVNNQAQNGAYAPPGSVTGGCGGVPCGVTIQPASGTPGSNGGVTGSSNTPSVNGSASGQPPQTVQSGRGPITTKVGPVQGGTIVSSRPVLGNQPSPPSTQALSALTGNPLNPVGPATSQIAVGGVIPQNADQGGGISSTAWVLIGLGGLILVWVILEAK